MMTAPDAANEPVDGPVGTGADAPGNGEGTPDDSVDPDSSADDSVGDGEDTEEEQGDGEDSGEEVRQARAPWHFKVIVVGSVVYLGYRLYQGISWLVHHL